MAGFFGLFDYNKPGPGVDKNAPKKKGFVRFFEIYFRKFWRLATANLLYILVSIPVVTGGLADAGLTYITRNFVREKHAFVSGDFFDTIKKNWKQALPVGIINLVLTLLLAFDLYFFGFGALGEDSGIMNMILLALTLAISLIFTFMKYYIPMMMITFKFTIKQLYKNALVFAFADLLRNLLIFVILAVFYVGGFFLFMLGPIGIVIDLAVFVLIFPAFRSYLIQYNIFPLIKKHIIDPYYEAHPDEDRTILRTLNIEMENDPALHQNAEEEPEAVFQDMGRTDKADPDEDEDKGRKNTIPKQYNEYEMRKGKRLTKNVRSDEDDDTI